MLRLIFEDHGKSPTKAIGRYKIGNE